MSISRICHRVCCDRNRLCAVFRFFFYDCFKKLFFGDRKDLHPLERLGAGGMAGMTACLLTYPLDFIRARLTLQGGSNVQYKGIVHGISSVVKESGVRGLYKGLWPSLVGIFPVRFRDASTRDGVQAGQSARRSAWRG